jgi:phosphatidylserine/phosphatidylglycerophosphate/cardiolipin synthase-like enzyme
MAFDWDQLHRYRAGAIEWPTGYPDTHRTFFSPADGPGIHALLVDLVASARHSVVLNVFGYDDDAIDQAIHDKIADPNVYVQMSLDSSQAAGVHEKAILAGWGHDRIGSSIAIGRSVKHAISHLKVLIVDGLYVVSGSTNWSISGETLQDNELLLIRNAVVAAQYRSILDLNHDAMLKQMAARRDPG